ncbi:microfibril-associated glycoprotein 4-like [Colossoma macropomum]|uniref:microfibril-associated glycoprotein 4-like n=1 Tax=Colossoma macropomum TaxID=42526 RepID=UPI00186545A2|nr:microfibril-associated glycoprotein 4-like [Colossoma macropomum]
MTHKSQAQPPGHSFCSLVCPLGSNVRHITVASLRDQRQYLGLTLSPTPSQISSSPRCLCGVSSGLSVRAPPSYWALVAVIRAHKLLHPNDIEEKKKPQQSSSFQIFYRLPAQPTPLDVATHFTSAVTASLHYATVKFHKVSDGSAFSGKSRDVYATIQQSKDSDRSAKAHQVASLRVFLALGLPLLVGSASVCQDVVATDCSNIYANRQKTSGVYTIYPAGDTPVEVQCDMGNEGQKDGNWTVIQKRMDGSVNFYRPWEQYKKGFGNKNGEYWLGLEILYQLTRKRTYELRVDLEDFEGGKVYAQYSTFSVDSEVNGYKLTVSGFINGGAGDSLATSNGQKFSTFDKDQDSWSGNCAKSFLGAFWYNACHHANPNGIYLWGRDGTLFAIGDVWYHWKTYDYGLKSITMKIRPVA